jgi:hypothetical protein
MSNFKLFIRETAETASFAVRAYFRPLFLLFHLLKSHLTPSVSTERGRVSKGSS